MLKKNSVLFISVVLICAASTSIFAKETNDESQTLNVHQYMKNFEKYSSQNVKIEGIVSKIIPKHNIVALIDVQELKECKVVTCAQLTLPIRWTGKMPQIKNWIQVSGKAKKEKNGYIFIANNLIIKESNPNAQ